MNRPLVIAAIVAVIFLGIFLLLDARKTVYSISTIEPITMYNHVGDNAYYYDSKPAAVASVLKYYGESLSPEQAQQLNNIFFDGSKQKIINLGLIRDYVKESFGYDSEYVKVFKIEDFTKYVYEQEIPLLAFLTLEKDQPESLKFLTAKVAIGINEKNKTIIFDSYYKGAGQEMPFDEFFKRNNHYLMAIIPKNENYKENLATRKTFPQATDVEKVWPVISNIISARVAWQQDKEMSFQYVDQAIKNPDFETLPPVLKVQAHIYAARWYLYKKEYESAQTAVNEAIRLNHDLEKPHGNYWAGWENRPDYGTAFTSTPQPYSLDGRIKEAEKKYPEAIVSYKKALEIWPNFEYVKKRLASVEKKLPK